MCLSQVNDLYPAGTGAGKSIDAVTQIGKINM